MTDHTNHAAPRPAPRRLLWAAWLAAVVLTSLGHSASTTYPGADTTPPLPEACKPGTEQIIPLGQAQSGYVGTPLGQSLALRFTCAGTYGRPFAGDPPRELIWQVVSGGGTIDGVTQIAASTVINSTFGFGQSTVNWTLGPGVVGTQTVTATVDGRVFTFLATAAPPGDGSGECSDPATLNGTVFDEQRVIRAPEVWTLAGSPYRGLDVHVTDTASVQIEPGVKVCLRSLTITGGQLLAVGTADKPIRFTGDPTFGLQLVFAGESRASELRHVDAVGISGVLAQFHPLLVEDARWQAHQSGDPSRDFHCTLFRPGPTSMIQVRRTVFEGFGRLLGNVQGCPAVELRATPGASTTPTAVPSVFEAAVRHSFGTGVEVWGGGPGGWQLQGCEVSGSSGDGIQIRRESGGQVPTPGVETLHGCALFGNGGLGVNNLQPGAFTVDARGNWWGDPAGAGGPAGDGVSAGVDASAPLAAAPVPN